MDVKRANVIKRLEARSRERQSRVQDQRAKAAESADPRESTEMFWKTFDAKENEIERSLNDMVETFKSETRKIRRQRMGGDPSEDPVLRRVSSIAEAIEKLQGRVTSASLFLPKYDMRSAQGRIGKLEKELKSAKCKLRPPKKFSFAGVRNRRQRGGAAKDAATALEKARKTSADEKKDVESTNASISSDRADKGLVISKKSKEIVRIPHSDASDSRCCENDVTLSDLSDCVVGICKRLSTARLIGLTSCHIYCGPVDGSVFIDRCKNCRIVLASRQVRIHSSTDCTFEVHTNSGPIIEDCTKLRFGPYPNLRYARSDNDFRASTLNFDARNESWRDVKDFKWHRLQASPNWSILDESDRTRTPVSGTSLGLRIDDSIDAPRSDLRGACVVASVRANVTNEQGEDDDDDDDDDEEL